MPHPKAEQITTDRPIKLLDLGEEWRTIGKQIQLSVLEVLSSGSYILGQQLSNFEKLFSDFLSNNGLQPFILGCASGTEAIALALRSLDIGPTKTVLTVANTCTPTAVGIRMTGAKLSLMDIDPVHLMMDPEILEKELSRSKIDAVVAVNLFGNTPPLDRISDICQRHGIPLVEDCAQSQGTRYQGKIAGTFGKVASFSFYPSKNLGAYGDAGAIATFDQDLATRLIRLRNYGYDPKQRDQALEEGFNSRLDEIQAAILSVKINYLEKWNNRRSSIAIRYDKTLFGNADIRPVIPIQDCQSARHLYVVRCRNRDRLKTYFLKNGIQTQIHYPFPLHLQPAYHFLTYPKGSFPNSEKAAEEILSIPLHPFLKEEEIQTVINAFKNYHGGSE